MNMIRKVIVALAFVAGLAVSPAASADGQPSGCSHWYLRDGEYTAGMGGRCETWAAGTKWSLSITCSNGLVLTTGIVPQGGFSYGKICPGTAVVNTHRHRIHW